MPCFNPLQGWRSRSVNPSGNRSIVFDMTAGYADLPVTIPCGRCPGCRLEQSRQWAVRCMHEASCHEANSFITLTYDNRHLPKDGNLDKAAFPLFMRRLRKETNGRRVRYFHSGEYGSRTGRPHYHSLLFGFDFSDKAFVTYRNGFPVWRSGVLERLWPYGRSEIGSVTFESAGYVARYCLKGVDDVEVVEADSEGVGNQVGGDSSERVRPYCSMSRRPGIGYDWFQKFGGEVYPADSVVVRGYECKPPRYYDKLAGLRDDASKRGVLRRRRERVNVDEQRSSRLVVREAVLLAKLKLKGGEL